MKKVFAVLLLGMLALSLMAFAFQGEPPFESIEALLIWLAFGGGSVALVGVVFTLFVFQLPTWHSLPYWLQITIPIIVAAIVGAGARVLLDLELYTSIPPAVGAVILALINWLAAQAAATSRLAQTATSRALKGK